MPAPAQEPDDLLAAIEELARRLGIKFGILEIHFADAHVVTFKPQVVYRPDELRRMLFDQQQEQ